jgi:hypothetical protein
MLLFTFAGIEASLNYMVQRLAAASGEDRSKFIRQKRIEDKLEYIEDKIRQQIDRSELDGLVEEYEFLRHEIVHHKRTDQQAQFHVQNIQPTKVIKFFQLFSVRIFVATHGEFPYWLTGWNYTGFSGNWSDLFLSNNGNGFGHTLGYMRYPFKHPFGPGSMDFATTHMSTLAHFENILAFLNAYPADAEPFSPILPMRPRLVRKWWDPFVTEAVAREAMDSIKAHHSG